MTGTQRRLAVAGAVTSALLVGWTVAWWWLGDFRAPPGDIEPARAAGYFVFATVIPGMFALGPFAWWGREHFPTMLRWGGGLLLAYATVTLLAGGFVWYVPGALLVLAGSRRLAEWL